MRELPEASKQRIIRAQEGNCFYCDKPLDVDIVWGFFDENGPTTWPNRVAAHKECNLQRGGKGFDRNTGEVIDRLHERNKRIISDWVDQ